LVEKREQEQGATTHESLRWLTTAPSSAALACAVLLVPLLAGSSLFNHPVYIASRSQFRVDAIVIT
jgi:hypothetical protein